MFLSIVVNTYVIWTDYVSSALLYECYRVEADQRCSPGADHITMLSRTHNMSQTVYDMMVEKVEQLCFHPERIGGLHHTTHDQCKIYDLHFIDNNVYNCSKPLLHNVNQSCK